MRSCLFVALMLVTCDTFAWGNLGHRITGDVAEALIGTWPSDDGEEYVIAVRACLEAIHGNLSPNEARNALIRAAEEAGIPVISVAH